MKLSRPSCIMPPHSHKGSECSGKARLVRSIHIREKRLERQWAKGWEKEGRISTLSQTKLSLATGLRLRLELGFGSGAAAAGLQPTGWVCKVHAPLPRQDTPMCYSGWLIMGKGIKRKWRRQTRKQLHNEGTSLAAFLAFTCTHREMSLKFRCTT